MRNILRKKIINNTFEDAWALGKLIFFTFLYTKQTIVSCSPVLFVTNE